MSIAMHKRQQGVTLLELMVVVAIIGILTVIGYPQYEQYVMRANRTEAKNLLMRIASEQEKFFSTFNRYSGSITGARTGNPATSGLNMLATSQDLAGGVPDPNDQAYYTIAVALTANNLGYTLTATPVGSMQTRDVCGAMAIDHLSNKTPTTNNCW